MPIYISRLRLYPDEYHLAFEVVYLYLLVLHWHTKGELEGPEYYYSHALQAVPRDGEVVSNYAQLVWELHHDQDKTSVYFECVVEDAPATRYHFAGSSCLFIVYVHDRDDNGQDNWSA